MPNYQIQLIDSYYLSMGQPKIRYAYRLDLEKDNWATQAWHQLPPYNSRYFITSGGSWKRMKLWNHIDGIAFENGNYSPLVLHTCRSGPMADFPSVGQWGTGILWDAHDSVGYPAHNVLWVVESSSQGTPDARHMWIGGGFKYGGMVPVWGKEAMHGWVINAANFGRKYYIQAETTRWGVGLGGGVGAVLLVITAPDPKCLIKQINGAWDFSFAVAGKWDSYLKLISKGGNYAKYLELGKFAKQVYDKTGIIHKSAFEEAANNAKLVFSGGAIDWNNPSLTALDVGGTGLEATVCFAQSMVTMAQPL